MISPTGYIPEELMYPQRKQDVINFLIAQPWPGQMKRRILEGWCVCVGVRVRPREYYLVDASDVQPTEVPPIPGV
jgi:hypothetical protein